jgi:hypothetical protein
MELPDKVELLFGIIELVVFDVPVMTFVPLTVKSVARAGSSQEGWRRLSHQL